MENLEGEQLLSLQQQLSEEKASIAAEKARMATEREELERMRAFLKMKEREVNNMDVLVKQPEPDDDSGDVSPAVVASVQSASKSASSLHAPHASKIPLANDRLAQTAEIYFAPPVSGSTTTKKKNKKEKKVANPTVAVMSVRDPQNSTQASFTKNLLSSHLHQKTTSQLSLLSLLTSAQASSSSGQHTQSLKWYHATLSFLQASDPNSLEIDTRLRCHLGMGDEYLALHRHNEAEKSFAEAVRLSKELKDKKQLEVACNKLGKLLISWSEILEKSGAGEEAYVALQRGIASLEEAIEGGADFLFGDVAVDLNEAERMLVSDRKVSEMIRRNKGRDIVEKLREEEDEAVRLDRKKKREEVRKRKMEEREQQEKSRRWQVTGKAEARKAIEGKIGSGNGGSAVPKKKLNEKQSLKVANTNTNTNTNTTPPVKNVETDNTITVDDNTVTSITTVTTVDGTTTTTKTTTTKKNTPQQKMTTSNRRKMSSSLSPEPQFGTIRSGRHLFVRRGCSLDHVAQRGYSKEEISSAALVIQGCFRRKLARKRFEEARRRNCVELWSDSIVVSGVPLVVVFSMVREPPQLVKSTVVSVSKTSDEYDVFARPSSTLTAKERTIREELKSRSRLCLEVDVYQSTGGLSDDKNDSECVFRWWGSQAEVSQMIPRSIGFVSFEHMDLDCTFITDNWKEWMPYISRRIVLQERFKAATEREKSAFERDVTMAYKLRIERTIHRSCGKVCWGPRWRRWWAHFYYQGEIHLERGILLLRCFSKSHRHPGIFTLELTTYDVTKVLGVDTSITSFNFRTLLESKDPKDVSSMWRIVTGKLRLINTTCGSKIVIAGEEASHHCVQWPEEREKYRNEMRRATVIQRHYRGVLGRRRFRRLKATWKDELAKKRRIEARAYESRRRSSAAVVLQASVKRGFARKKAVAMQEIRDHAKKEREKERQKERRIHRNAINIQRIVRAFVARCQFARRVYEKRSEELEKEGRFETQKYIDGTRLYITGRIQSGLDSIEDVVFRMEAMDLIGGRKTTITVGNVIIAEVIKDMEKEVRRAKRKEIDYDGRYDITLRKVFLRSIDKLTLFKNKEKNIFILAYRGGGGKKEKDKHGE